MIVCPYCKHQILIPKANILGTYQVGCRICFTMLSITIAEVAGPQISGLALIEAMNVNPDYKKELKDQYEREHPKPAKPSPQ
jgi:hypothetical protein